MSPSGLIFPFSLEAKNANAMGSSSLLRFSISMSADVPRPGAVGSNDAPLGLFIEDVCSRHVEAQLNRIAHKGTGFRTNTGGDRC